LFYDRLHDKGYSFNGDAPITGLTSDEIAMLQLAYLVELDAKQRQMDDSRRDRPDSFGSVSESRADAFS